MVIKYVTDIFKSIKKYVADIIFFGDSRPMVKLPKSPWGLRAHAAGLDLRTLALLSGRAYNSVSRALRGEWESGVPTNLILIIVAWEIMDAAQREAWLDAAKKLWQDADAVE
jgi:hypothetical protein